MPTVDLSEFGNRELELMKDILDALMNNGVPEDFDEDGMQIAFNPESGEVFLTNSDSQVAMESDGKLYSWYYLSYAGNEGFAEDLYDDFTNGDVDPEDYDELADILDFNGMNAEANEVRNAIEEEY